MRLVSGGSPPHAGPPIAAAGAPLAEATTALVLLHGRGGSAADLLGVAGLVAAPSTACLALQAADNSWYPNRFTEPVGNNEPNLGAALGALGDLVDRLRAGGMPAACIALLGFSQGLSGGLIGDVVAEPAASPNIDGLPLDNMPLLLACSEHDPHIPIGRVRETERVMRTLGANVLLRVYPDDSHEIKDDEISLARRMLKQAYSW